MKKLTIRKKTINRIYRRLKTMEGKDIALKLKVTKRGIDETLKANAVRVTKNNANDVVNEFIRDAQVTTKEKAKAAKKYLGLKKYSDVQKLSGMDLHNEIAGLYDSDMDDEADAILEAYGY